MDIGLTVFWVARVSAENEAVTGWVRAESLLKLCCGMLLLPESLL
jgi:hypothetical protein